MKKRLVAVLAGLMVLTFGATSAFAAISSTTSDALTEAGVTNPSEVGSVLTGSVSEVSTDDDGNVYSVIELTEDLEDGTYYIVIDGVAYEVVVEDNVATIYGYEAVEGEDISDLTLYADDDADSDEGDEDDDTDSDDDDDTDSSDDDTTSPGTGEASALPLVAVAVLAGVVVCGKKIYA